MSVLVDVQSVIEEVLGVDAQRAALDAKLIDDLGANSLDIVELAMALEAKFDLEIQDSEIDRIQTVGQLVEYLEGRLEKTVSKKGG